MTDKTIPDLDAGTTLTGSEPIETVQGGASVRTTTGEIAGSKSVININSSGMSQDISPITKIVLITSGGSAGTELVNLLNPDLDLDGFVNANSVGNTVVFALVALTNPDDKVKITNNSADNVYIYGGPQNGGLQYMQNVVLDYVGACARFIWCADEWKLDYDATDGEFDGDSFYGAATLHGINSNGIRSAEPSIISGGNGDAGGVLPASYVGLLGGASAGINNGGDISINAGIASGTGIGGNIIIDAGTGIDENGNILVGANTPLPIIDPGISGAVWSRNGALLLSGATIEQVIIQDFTFTPGVITALTGTEVTTAIAGLLTTDQVHVEYIGGAPPSGMIIANTRVSAANTLAIYFVTAVALGITLGSLTFRLTTIR